MLFSRDRKFRKPRPNPDDVLACPVRSPSHSLYF